MKSTNTREFLFIWKTKKKSFPSDHWHLFAEQFGARKTYKAVRQDAFRSNHICWLQ